MKGFVRIGVDVGGTNTDAVVLRDLELLAERKAPTTQDVGGGIVSAVSDVLTRSGIEAARVDAVMIGTTHFTNAFVEARQLNRIGVLRLGAPATLSVRPMIAWPKALRSTVLGHAEILPGGYHYDGRIITPFDEKAVHAAAKAFRERDLTSIAISSVFAPVNADMEKRAAAIILEHIPGAAITLSHEIGRIGLIERENAAAMNAALADMASKVVASFQSALTELGIRAPLYISQNDGTLLEPSRVARHPVLTFASGPTNSMRGAAFLQESDAAVVIDIGGTTSDFGALVKGFPRESSVAVDIGGVRTNFRMPDVISIGLGGGSLVQADQGRVKVGPRSVGYRLTSEALVFGGQTLTASDIAVAAGYANIGDADRVRHLDRSLVESAVNEIHRILEEGLDRIKTSAAGVPVILVGGGSVLVDRPLRGAAEMNIPPNAGVANAIGAAIAQVSGEVDRIFSYEKLGRDSALATAKEEAIAAATAAGGRADTMRILDVEEVPLQYLPGNAVRVRVKAIGDLR